MCFDEGVLQAYLDGEMTDEENKQIEGHLVFCSQCRDLLKELKENNNFVQLQLTTYQKQMERLKYVPKEYCHHQKKEKEKKGVFALLKKYKKLAGAVAAAACLGVLLSFAPVRSLAAQFLTLFRVQEVKTTAISIDDLNKIQQAFHENNCDIDIENLGKIENQQSGKYQEVTWEEAASLVDFNIKKPSYLPKDLKYNPGYDLEPANQVAFTLNIENINAVVKQLGGKHLFPANLDGNTFTLNIAQSVHASARNQEGEKDKYLNLTQTKIPEINVPKNIDVFEVREAILDLPVIPNDVKQKLAALDNWQNTLYIPQPENGTAEEIQINGAQGVIVKESRRNGDKYLLLMWQSNGILYMLSGDNIAADELIKVANSIE